MHHENEYLCWYKFSLWSDHLFCRQKPLFTYLGDSYQKSISDSESFNSLVPESAAVSYLPFNKYPVITYSLHWHLKCFLQECKRNTADPTYSNSYYKPCIYEKIFLLFNFNNSYLGETTPHPFYLDEKIKNTFFHTVALCFHKIVTKNNEDWWGKNSSLQIIAWIWVIFQ